MNKFIVYTNPYKDTNGEFTAELKAFIIENGGEIVAAEEPSVTRTDRSADKSTDDTADPCGAIVLVLGGDGTMLRAIRELRSKGPYIGINLGNLGFLTEIDKAGYKDAVIKLIKDEFDIEKRMLLEGCVIKKDGTTVTDYLSTEASKDALCDSIIKDKSGSEAVQCVCECESNDNGCVRALNDVVLSRCGSLKILKFDIYVNGQLLHNYLADGVIVSTPTGSTGYNLSAGGPIASPGSEVIMLTPICPHSLNQRSIILSSNDKVEIGIPESKDGAPQQMEVSFDGANNCILETGDRILIRRSERFVNFAKLGKDSFLEVLNHKMHEK